MARRLLDLLAWLCLALSTLAMAYCLSMAIAARKAADQAKQATLRMTFRNRMTNDPPKWTGPAPKRSPEGTDDGND